MLNSFFFFYLGTETQLKRSSSLKKETSRSFSSSRKSRSVPDKHLEVLLAADHLYLNKFHSDKEATDLLLTLANIVSTSYYSPRFVVCLLLYLSNHYWHICLSMISMNLFIVKHLINFRRPTYTIDLGDDTKLTSNTSHWRGTRSFVHLSLCSLK